MRHRKGGRKLNRTSAHRKALNRNLTRSLILHGRIKTTVPKAKEVIPFASRLVTLAKDGSLAARRRAVELMGENEAVGKLFSEIAPRFADRPGGYLRIVKLPFPRLGDRAEQAYLEFVEEEVVEAQETTGKKKRKQKKLSRKAKREQEKKERKKHDLEKIKERRAEAAKAEAEEAAEAAKAEEAEEAKTPEEAGEPTDSEPPQETEQPEQSDETKSPEQTEAPEKTEGSEK
jgi:large subunit ribosomal protein L17